VLRRGDQGGGGMKARPVAIMGGLPELRQRVAAGHHDFAIMLAGGAAISRKTIHLLDMPPRWRVRNEIDNTSQTLTDEDLWAKSHVGLALDRNALLDMSGDPLLDIKDRGPVLGSTLTEEARAQREEAKSDDPLVFRLDAAPGAMWVDEPDEWEPADPSLVLGICEIGPHTVASIDITATGFGFKDNADRAAATSIELTIEDIDAMIATLNAIKWDAIENRGFLLREDGYWTNGEE